MATVNGAFQAAIRLLNAQIEHFVDGGRAPWSADVPRNMRAVDMFLQARSAKHTVSALTDIVTLFDPEIKTHGGDKAPGAPHRTGTGGELVQMRTSLAEKEWGMEIGWHEIQGQAGDPNGPHYTQKIYDLHEKTTKDLIVGAVKQLEQNLMAPFRPAMISGNGDGSYPIKSMWTGINTWTTDHYDGTGAAGSGGDGLFPGMTDQQGLDPNDAKFARRDGLGGATQLSATKLGYSSAATNETSSSGHIFDRMDELIDLVNWEPTPMASGYSEGMRVRPRVVMCTREGKSLMNRTLRAHGESFALVSPVADGSTANTQFAGIPLLVSDTLAGAKIYPQVYATGDAGGTLDEDGAANRYIGSDAQSGEYEGVTEFNPHGILGGRYYFIDTDSTNLWMHGARAFTDGGWKTMAPINEDLYRRLIKMIGNLHHERFVTNAILYPSANISGYAQSA